MTKPLSPETKETRRLYRQNERHMFKPTTDKRGITFGGCSCGWKATCGYHQPDHSDFSFRQHLHNVLPELHDAPGGGTHWAFGGGTPEA